MKKIIALLMVCVIFLTGCNTTKNNHENKIDVSEMSEDLKNADDMNVDVDVEQFSDLSDEKLLQYIEDDIYAGITEQLASEDYIVESVDAIYISKEYLEEILYLIFDYPYKHYTFKYFEV